MPDSPASRRQHNPDIIYETEHLGATPTIATRLQELAAPNTVVISDASYQLVQGYFVCEPLGKQPLRDVSDPLTVGLTRHGSSITRRRVGLWSSRRQNSMPFWARMPWVCNGCLTS